MLDLLCLSVPLLISTAFIVIRHRKLELFSHPLYVAVCFISYIDVYKRQDMNQFIIEKDKTASVKYYHRTNLEEFVIDSRSKKANC